MMRRIVLVRHAATARNRSRMNCIGHHDLA